MWWYDEGIAGGWLVGLFLVGFWALAVTAVLGVLSVLGWTATTPRHVWPAPARFPAAGGADGSGSSARAEASAR